MLKYTPECLPYSFHIQDNDSHHQNIVIYWKGLNDKLFYGGQFYHKIIVVHRRNDVYLTSKIEREYLNSVQKTFYNLDPNTMYMFTVYSVDTNENAKTNCSIYVNRKLLDRPSKIKVINDNPGEYSIMWKRPKGNSESKMRYTVFWCKQSPLESSRCSSDLGWNFTKNNYYHLKVDKSIGKIKIGVAATTSIISNKINGFDIMTSGIVWSETDDKGVTTANPKDYYSHETNETKSKDLFKISIVTEDSMTIKLKELDYIIVEKNQTKQTHVLRQPFDADRYYKTKLELTELTLMMIIFLTSFTVISLFILFCWWMFLKCHSYFSNLRFF